MDKKAYLDDALHQFRGLKRLADGAMTQVTEEQFFTSLDPESNSIAIIVKHIAGNMFSRWTDFLTSDGEKPGRNRDGEFVIDVANDKQSLLRYWEDGWTCLFAAIEPLTPSDLERTIYIRKQPHSVLQAINRQMTHYAGHVGQIVFLAKHLAGKNWQTLSMPRKKP
jgi:hypothetical protein